MGRLVERVWFSWPITRSSREKFTKDVQTRMADACRRVRQLWESSRGRVDSSRIEEAVLQAGDLERRGTWPYSDVIGFLEVGPDRGDQLAGEILLRRKCFPRGAKERILFSGTRLQEVLFYAELGRSRVVEGDTLSYVSAIRRFVREAEKMLRRRLRGACVAMPDLDLASINFTELHGELRAVRKRRIREEARMELGEDA